MVKFYATNSSRYSAICVFVVIFALGAWVVLSFNRYSASVPRQDIYGSRDAVVILTGGHERIAAGLHLAELTKQSKGYDPAIYISGVHSQSTLSELEAFHRQHKHLFDCCVTIGRSAESTCGNARESSKWLRGRGIKSISLITSDYHMARANLEFSRMWPEGEIGPVPTSELVANLQPRSDWQWLGEIAKFGVTYLTDGVIPCRLGPSSDATWQR